MKKSKKILRQELLYSALIEKCIYFKCYEFECVWMFVDLLQSILIVKIDEQTIDLTFDNISTLDFDNLEKVGLIEKIKDYEIEELNHDEDLRIRYKINLTKVKSNSPKIP